MRKELIVAALATIALLVLYNGQEQKGDAFADWKSQYGANWGAEEESYRRLIFERNLLKIERHNADESQTYKMGVNQFTVFSDDEFAKLYLNPMIASEAPQNVEETELPHLIGDVDWTTKGKVSGVKNQGQCGSCWAFSATGVMESWSLMKGTSVNLSEQQLVDCSRSYGNQGCNGGWPYNALKYAQNSGMASTSEYPYVAKDQTCKKTGGSFKISGYNSYSGCNGLQSQINNSPVSVCVDASNWSAYRSGAFSNCRSSINHAVLLVGIVGGNWKIKNSWGASWGESGYIRLANAGSSTCGVCSVAGVVPK